MNRSFKLHSDSSDKTKNNIHKRSEHRKLNILIYTVSTLAKLFSLDHEKISSLIEAEGVLAYDGRNFSKVGYLPTLASYFKVDSAHNRFLGNNIKAEWFDIKSVNDVTTVTAVEPSIPVTSYLFSSMYEELTHTEKSSILLPMMLSGKKLFIADDLLIRRLSQGVSEDYIILPFIKGEPK